VLRLAGFTYGVIKQNLWWAFGYNTVAISAAFFGYVHPLIAATAMLASSATVITNSMRILRWKQDVLETGGPGDEWVPGQKNPTPHSNKEAPV
jgi:cation transport ATPase